MRTHWLIDGEMFDHYRDDLVAAIKRQGDRAVLIRTPSPPYRWEDVDCKYRDAIPPGACVVAHGDIELCTRVHAEQLWTPGAYCAVEEFFWSRYSGRLSRFLLNADSVALPFGELPARRGELLDRFGVDGKFFVRPDSPLKLFTGQLVSQDTFEADFEYLGFYEFPDSSEVVVSSPKAIAAEWRFVVVGGRVITGSLYRRADQFTPEASIDPGASDFAALVAGCGFAPEPVWVADVCRTKDDEYRLVEVGGFSFSDLYACDVGRVVAEVSEVALAEWKAASPSH